MALSEVAIYNLALQKLEAQRVASVDEDSTNAIECNACYAHLRDLELRKYNWNFARKRATLAPSSVTPDFDYDYAFPVPSDFLRLLPLNTYELDWRIENHEGQVCILTNDGTSLEINYIARITNTGLFDPCFEEMLACKIADHLCGRITGSNTKKKDVRADYQIAKADARRLNAFENISEEPPEDSWVAERR